MGSFWGTDGFYDSEHPSQTSYLRILSLPSLSPRASTIRRPESSSLCTSTSCVPPSTVASVRNTAVPCAGPSCPSLTCLPLMAPHSRVSVAASGVPRRSSPLLPSTRSVLRLREATGPLVRIVSGGRPVWRSARLPRLFFERTKALRLDIW